MNENVLIDKDFLDTSVGKLRMYLKENALIIEELKKELGDLLYCYDSNCFTKIEDTVNILNYNLGKEFDICRDDVDYISDNLKQLDIVSIAIKNNFEKLGD